MAEDEKKDEGILIYITITLQQKKKDLLEYLVVTLQSSLL